MKKLIAIPALFLAACATQPEPCTAEWFDWKTERIFDEFARENRVQIDQVRADFARKPDGIDRAASGLQAALLAGMFVASAVPEANRAISQCGSAPNAARLLASFLRREGFDEDTLAAIEAVGVALDRGSIGR
jgi:hypothetical protein